MSNKTMKPKMTPRQLVEKMRDEKGITFKLISEDEAELFLTEKNNYIRTASYRKVYDKYEKGIHKGKYIDLDFGYLKELSILDMHYRFLVEKMCSDIEHSLCILINSLVEQDSSTDGYDIVYQFLNSRPNTIHNIEQAISSPHTGNLIQKYFTIQTTQNSAGRIVNKIITYDDCPVWVLTEVTTFGDIIHFYDNYCKSRKIPSEPIQVLHLIRSLRNAAAHNNCLFVDLKSGSTTPPLVLSKAVSQLKTISNTQRKKRLSCRSTLEFVALIYEYDHLVFDKVRKYRLQQLTHLFYNRMIKSKNYFKNNALLYSTYDFSIKIIEGFLL